MYEKLELEGSEEEKQVPYVCAKVQEKKNYWHYFDSGDHVMGKWVMI
jgi:hypothetical protein